MKKVLLLSAVLLGAVTASQAGVRFDIGIPLPVPPVVVTPPGRVYVEPPPVYHYAPAPPVFDFRFGNRRPIYRPYPYRYHRDYWHHGWNDHRWDHHYGGDHHYRGRNHHRW